MREPYKQLTHDDRVSIDRLLRAGHSKRYIADTLHCHISTVYREIKRGLCDQIDSKWRPYQVYSYVVADGRHKRVFAHKGAPVKLHAHPELISVLETLIIVQRYSPGSASAILRRSGGLYLSENTIYRYVNRRMFPRLRRHNLPEKGIRKHPSHVECKTKKQPRYGDSIEKRPVEVTERLSVGHWEGDSIVGKIRGKGESCLVFTERKSLLQLVFKVDSKTSGETVSTLDRLSATCDFPRIFQSITFDNGSEFANSHRIMHGPDGDRRTSAYYCHPYTSCERARNENANRLIRRWLPKGRSMKDVTQEQALAISRWMNTYPRQSLGWKTPAQVFLEECKKQGIKISLEFSQYLS